MSLGGKQYLYYARLHEKYGDAVRIGVFQCHRVHLSVTKRNKGPNEVSICSVDAVQPMLGNNGIPKGACELKVFHSQELNLCLSHSISVWDGRIPEAEAVKPLIAVRDKTEHTRRRRPWTRAFSTAALKGYEELVEKRANQLVDTMTQNGSFDLSQLISFFACVMIFSMIVFLN